MTGTITHNPDGTATILQPTFIWFDVPALERITIDLHAGKVVGVEFIESPCEPDAPAYSEAKE